MKKMIVVVWLCILFVARTVLADVSVEGGKNLLNYENWLPQKAYIAFHYNSQGKLTGYRVAFQAADGELFDEWKLRSSGGNMADFPFVLESTLIIDNSGEVEKTDSWGFGRLDGENSSIPDAYIDSTFLDVGEDNYGIGIVSPKGLREDVIYDYWMELREDDAWVTVDPRDLEVKLRFRLNMDLAAAKKFGYSKDEIERDFVMGDGWEGVPWVENYGYDEIDINRDYSTQYIGDYLSFAIEKYSPSDNLTYSYYFVLDGMEGQWCKSAEDEHQYRVDSLEECFNLNEDEVNSTNSGISEMEGEVDGAIGNVIPINAENSPTLTPHLHIFRSGEDHELDPDRHTVYVGEMLDFEVIIKSEEEIKDQLNGDDHLRIDLDYEKTDDWKEIEDFRARKENLDETRHTEYATWRVPDDGETRIRFRIHIDNTGQTITTDWFDVRKRQFDGIVSNVSAPTRAYANQNVTVTVTVANDGSETPTEETQLAIYLPDSSGNFKRKSNFVDIGPAELASGASLARTFNIVMPDQPGTYVFAAYYDPRLKGDETDEKNNIKTFSITVSPASPDLYITNRWLDEGGAVKKGKDAHANCTVGNIGIATPTAKDVHVHYLFDGREVDDDEFKSHHVTPGHSRTVEDRGGFKMKNSGTHTYTCCADPHNRISESNESNNCSSMTFTVK